MQAIESVASIDASIARGSTCNADGIIAAAGGIGATGAGGVDTEGVIALAKINGVTACSNNGVIAGIAIEAIDTRSTINGVIAIPANEDVITGEALDGVITAVAVDQVVA